MLDRLEEQGELDNTIVIYMSDNGQFWGEHNLDGKELVYEEAIRVPLGIRYPKAFPEGRVENALWETSTLRRPSTNWRASLLRRKSTGGRCCRS